MPYSEGRVVHDADAHIMETPTWLRDHAEASVPRPPAGAHATRAATSCARRAAPRSSSATWWRRSTDCAGEHASAEYRADEAGGDHGAQELRRHRRRSSPRTGPGPSTCSGSAASSIFNTFHNGRLHDLEHGDDLDLAYAAARAHNRGMLEFCSVDPRLLPSCYVPLADPERAVAAAAEDAIDQGAAALLVASGCPPRFSPSHRDLFGVWAQAEEAGIPVVFHVGGTGDLIDPQLLRQRPAGPARLPRRRREFPLRRLHGHPRPAGPDAGHPHLRRRAGAFPRAASSGSSSRGRSGCRRGCARWSRPSRPSTGTRSGCRRCRCGPSDYVHRQVRFTPYPTEDVGWIVDQAGADLVMFSSDYPHVEGGRKPLERFEASLGDAGRGRAPAVLLRQLPVPDGPRRDRLAA